jgi:hypothetical protein
VSLRLDDALMRLLKRSVKRLLWKRRRDVLWCGASRCKTASEWRTWRRVGRRRRIPFGVDPERFGDLPTAGHQNPETAF